MKDLQYLVSSGDVINNVVHKLLDYRVALILKPSDLIECVDHVFDSVLFIRLAVVKLKLLELFTEDITQGAIGCNEAFNIGLSRRNDHIAKGQVEIDR